MLSIHKIYKNKKIWVAILLTLCPPDDEFLIRNRSYNTHITALQTNNTPNLLINLFSWTACIRCKRKVGYTILQCVMWPLYSFAWPQTGLSSLPCCFKSRYHILYMYNILCSIFTDWKRLKPFWKDQRTYTLYIMCMSLYGLIVSNSNSIED